MAWSAPFPDYAPREYTAPSVLANDVTRKRDGWADEVDPHAAFARRGRPHSFSGELRFDVRGRPLNPFGRTGSCGRGLLGKWGPNFAADPVITRLNPDSHQLEMLAIRRRDNGRWAIPGGMVDDGEQVSAALTRELREETGVALDLADARLVYRGYVDDPRNTDNAWVETTVMHKHLPPELAARIHPSAGDDAVAFRWMPLTAENIDQLHASHGSFVRAVVARFSGDGFA